MAAPLIPTILSGGAGTRLWPVSREALPKPFMKMPQRDGTPGRTLLRKTFDRAVALPGASAPWIVTNREYYFLSRDELATAPRGSETRFLLEPAGRNTAPAILLATLAVAAEYGEDACLLVLAADHLIEHDAAFAVCVARAQSLAAQGWLVTFGITAKSPATGYGYIRAGEPINGIGRAVRQFVEKPDLARAQQYVADGNYLWNSGMFCFRAGDMLRAFESLKPELHRAGAMCWEASRDRTVGGDGIELAKDTFAACESISIDYAIFEQAPKVAVVPGDIGWSDVGAWNEIAAQYPQNEAGNRAASEAIFVDSQGCFVHSHDRLVATLGLKDVYVVDTPDALLVLDKSRAQDVKKIVDQVKARGGDKHAFHVTVSRPWGTYTLLQEAPGFKIKRIEVKPGRALSLQMHYHRSEHWIVVSGTAKVVNGDNEFLVRTNESTYIPAGTRHRLENPGKMPLVMIEVQSGSYLGEDDIVRFEDRYGRT
ncbi:MAG: mannose-1-phosphate guanylyltransferase/mannose-6-phosphate isomerase [Burkholderiaceae bacterium]|nr:mannose-1-phosphate guanylyltransferase/mannose-6-phosphate isomerase [Burkholderiaceae bacterium]